ncbi:MAG: DNA methyltransferase [Rhodospirillaceae bacterium]
MSDIRVINGDCLQVMDDLAREGVQVDSIVCDPPYHLTSIVKRFGKNGSAPAKVGATGAFARASKGFMGKEWDGGDIAFRPETWKKALRLLKPGGHLLAFSGDRTYGPMAWAIEQAGFDIRGCILDIVAHDTDFQNFIFSLNDEQLGLFVKLMETGAGMLAWTYGTGFPKSTNLAKLDPAHADVLAGLGTALKPSFEPVCIARKPIGESSIAANVLKYGTGAFNIDACRIPYADAVDEAAAAAAAAAQRSCHDSPGRVRWGEPDRKNTGFQDPEGSLANFMSNLSKGRWPANIVHDGSAEVLAAFPRSDGQSGAVTGAEPSANTNNVYGQFGGRPASVLRGDRGSSARFYHSAKADADDRMGSKHPTVKPIDLMAWLVRLVTPKGGTVLDCFAGSGTTGIAALREGCNAILIEREPEYFKDIQTRIAHARGQGGHSAAVKMRHREQKTDDLPLFGAPKDAAE